MKRVLKWTALTTVAIAAVLLLAIYLGSDWRLRQTFDIAATPIAVSADAATLASR